MIRRARPIPPQAISPAAGSARDLAVATTVDWRPGEDAVVLPFITAEEAEALFAAGGGLRKERSCLRCVRDPSLRRL